MLPQGFYPNYPLEIDWLRVALWAVFLGLCVIAVSYLYRYLRQRFKKDTVVLTPRHKRSLWQDTRDLFVKDIPADIRSYYFETSEALCACLGCAELTLSEIRMKSFAEASLFVQALSLAETVKFAKYLPTTEETTQYRLWALQVLDANIPAEDAHV